MGKEIERKFLVKREPFPRQKTASLIRQGFLSTQPQRTVRIRIKDDQATLTVKGGSHNLSRLEFEYPIPLQDAEDMLNKLCLKPVIRKFRHKINLNGFRWEVDEFKDENEGLWIAEIELDDENQEIELPDWLGQEVTGDPKYYNASLIENPYSSW